jgi:hypothetical protein
MKSFKELSTGLKIVFLVLIVVTVLSLSAALSYSSKLSALQNPNKATEEEISKVVAAVGKVLVLPTNETPTLATVSDPAKLKDQPFFINALSGDKVLIYTNARKAVLWRPSISKIIEVSPLNVPAVAAPTPTKTK